MRREIRQRIYGEQIDPGGGAGKAIRTPAAHRRAELLRKAQQAEVIDVHLGARGIDARTVADDDGRLRIEFNPSRPRAQAV